MWIAISVEDSGRGLAPEELAKLFARFSQARPKSDQCGLSLALSSPNLTERHFRFTGTGLGLYVAKKIVELQHGFIEVESTIDHGSTFRFAIPVQRCDDDGNVQGLDNEGSTSSEADELAHKTEPLEGVCVAVRRETKADEASSTPRPSPATVAREPLSHVLIVEDNLINQRVLSRQLRTRDLEISVANHGKEGMDALLNDKERKIDVVLCDIEMPVMGGIEMVKTVREMEAKGELTRYVGLAHYSAP